MVYMKGVWRALMAQRRGQIQLLIIAPIITLSLLGLVVRSASSAVDRHLAKRQVVEHLKRRLQEVQNGSLRKGQQEDEILASSGLLPPEQIHSPAWLDAAEDANEFGDASTATSMLAPEILLSYSYSDIEEVPTDSIGLPDQAQSPSQQQTFPFETTHRIKRRDTLEAILQAQGVPSRSARIWVAAAKKQKLARKLKSGRLFSFVFSEGEDAPVLTRLTYEIDALSHLTFEKTADGEITAQTKTLPTKLVWRAVGGRITSSLYKAAVKADVPAGIVDEMADMDWHLNFSTDLKSGDTFKVIFEEIQNDGKAVDYGRVLAAEIVNEGKASKVFSLLRAGRGGGANTRASSDSSTIIKGGQPFLRYPVNYTRISSVFAHSRFHPVLKKKRPHYGVDFAAPRGTPVRAVANGKVTRAGWIRGFGRIVRINHPGPYGSEYAHLHKIARRVKVGTQVKRGQVIGTVGSTGLATGPHLHFGLFKNGTYVNPLGKNLPRSVGKRSKQKAPQLDPVRAKLKKILTQYLAQLEIDATSTTRVLAAVETQKTAQAAQAKKPRS